jgi:hypothetical protein
LWHTDQDSGLQLANITGAVTDRRVGEGADSAVPKSATPEECSILEDEFENMCGREVGKEDITRPEVLADNDIDTSN